MEEDEVDWREFLAAQEWAELYIINTKPVIPISLAQAPLTSAPPSRSYFATWGTSINVMAPDWKPSQSWTLNGGKIIHLIF